MNATAESGWENIGWRELEPALQVPVVQFHQAVGNPRCIIFDTSGNQRNATPEECMTLERAAVWEDAAVRQRLLDTFAGRPNATFDRQRPTLGGMSEA